MELHMKTDDHFLYLLGFAAEVFEEFIQQHKTPFDAPLSQYMSDFEFSALTVHAKNYDPGDVIGWGDARLSSLLGDLVGNKPPQELPVDSAFTHHRLKR